MAFSCEIMGLTGDAGWGWDRGSPPVTPSLSIALEPGSILPSPSALHHSLSFISGTGQSRQWDLRCQGGPWIVGQAWFRYEDSEHDVSQTILCIQLLAQGVWLQAPGTNLFVLSWRWKEAEVTLAQKALSLGVWEAHPFPSLPSILCFLQVSFRVFVAYEHK